MTKNLSSKGHRGGNTKTGGEHHKKSAHQNSQNANQQNETTTTINSVVIAAVQKASIDLKMLTPEQKRLANLMNDKVDVTEIEKKINKIMELTGSSKDKAIVALHDCANELDKAIDMILEGDSINESEWKSQARKKKPKAGQQTGGKDETSVHLNGDAKKSNKGRQIRGGKSQNHQQQQTTDKQQSNINKSERGTRPRGDWKERSRETTNHRDSNNDVTTTVNNNKEIDSNDKLDDWPEDEQTTQVSTSAITNNNVQSRETTSSRTYTRSTNDNQFKSHSNRYQNNRENYDRDGGRRMNQGSRDNYNSNRNNQFGTSGDRNYQRSNERMDRRPYQNKGYNSRDKKPGSYTNSIDTWSNLTATDNSTSNNNDFVQMTVGNWSDVVSSNTAAVQQHQTNNQTTDLNNDDEWKDPSDNLTIEQGSTNKVFSNKENVNSSAQTKSDEHQLSKLPNLASIVSGVKPSQVQTNVHKSPQLQTTNTSKPTSQQQQILSTSNNQSILNKSPQQQRQPSQKAPLDISALLKSSQQQQQSQTNNFMKGYIQPQRNPADSNTYGAALLQRLQKLSNTDQDSSTLGKASTGNLSDYVNPYNQNKNLVHNIPSTNYNQSNAPSNLSDNQSHHLHHHQNVADQKSLMEKKRRQTKIPETAVEMPTTLQTSEQHISSLNVQFGALDFSNSDAYGLNDDQMTNKSNQYSLSSRDRDNEKSTTTSLLNSVRGNQQSNDNNKVQQSKESLLQNIEQHHHSSHHPHQLQDNILQQHSDSRNKPNQQSNTGGYQLNAYNKNDGQSNQHSSIYPPNLQNYHQSNYGSVNNFGSQNHNNSSNAAGQSNAANANQQQQQQKMLKDLSDNSSSTNNQNNNSASANTTSSSSALGNLVNNTTVTTNVLKNSLTATGKTAGGNSMQQQLPPNVGPGPLLGTPQYIMNMSQPGLSTAFYPVYDMPMATDHSFRYNQNTSQDVKYNRGDAQDGSQVGQTNSVQSTQAPVTQTPNHQIFSQFPPYFFYTGVNMMTQGLYQTPFLPVQPNPASGNVSQPHAPNSNQPSGFPKGAPQNQPAYSAEVQAYMQSINYANVNDSLSRRPLDPNKPHYGPPDNNQNQQQTGKQMSSGNSNDLTSNNMYTKSHAQLTKNFDKPNAFQTGTPPPFGIATLGYNPNQFIPMMQPQSNPSLLHHSLSDANQNNAGNQRSQAQKNSASNTKNYYTNWS